MKLETGALHAGAERGGLARGGADGSFDDVRHGVDLVGNIGDVLRDLVDVAEVGVDAVERDAGLLHERHGFLVDVVEDDVHALERLAGLDQRVSGGEGNDDAEERRRIGQDYGRSTHREVANEASMHRSFRWSRAAWDERSVSYRVRHSMLTRRSRTAHEHLGTFSSASPPKSRACRDGTSSSFWSRQHAFSSWHGCSPLALLHQPYGYGLHQLADTLLYHFYASSFAMGRGPTRRFQSSTRRSPIWFFLSRNSGTVAEYERWFSTAMILATAGAAVLTTATALPFGGQSDARWPRRSPMPCSRWHAALSRSTDTTRGRPGRRGGPPVPRDAPPVARRSEPRCGLRAQAHAGAAAAARSPAATFPRRALTALAAFVIAPRSHSCPS